MHARILLFTAMFALALHAGAATFAIPGAGVSFAAPDGFTELSKEEIGIKYPSARAPAFVVGNDGRTTTIAYDLQDHQLPPDKLGEVKASFEELFSRIIPGIEWKERKIVRMQGQDWIVLELTSRAVDTDIHNIMLVTHRRGKMLVFNFNSTKDEFPSVAPALRKSIESIAFSDIR